MFKDNFKRRNLEFALKTKKSPIVIEAKGLENGFKSEPKSLGPFITDSGGRGFKFSHKKRAIK